jgi:site-specific recombinase XerD
MSAFAPLLQAFFTDRLIGQRRASEHTITGYRDTFRLLLAFAATQTDKKPCALDIADLDAPLIGAFLDYLEHARGNQIRTRNNRLAAIHSLFGYAALRHPEHAASIQRVLAIRPNDANASWSAGSPNPRSTPFSPLPTEPPGPGGETTPCCYSRSRPGCGSPN